MCERSKFIEKQTPEIYLIKKNKINGKNEYQMIRDIRTDSRSIL